VSQLTDEIFEIPDRLAGLAAANAAVLDEAAARWRTAPPPTLFTVARGTSDAAATYAAYRLAAATGVPVGSLPPSLASLYGFAAATPLWSLAISQSGRSPDLIAAQAALHAGGGVGIALVNDTASPLADGADLVLDQAVGPELSIAATKSFACSLAAVDLLAQALTGGAVDDRLDGAARAAAEALAAPPDLELLDDATHAYVVGRGKTFAVAIEAALKLKETAGLHAEALSAAEIMHGPRAIAGPELPVLGFAGPGKAGASVREALDGLKSQGSRVAVVECAEAADLPEELAPVVLIAGFYAALPALARRRGRDPDNPPSLTKVTLTV